MSTYNAAFCFKSSLSFSTISRRTFSASTLNTVEAQKFLTDHIDNFTKCVETFRKVSSEIKRKKLEFVEQLSEVSESSIASAARIKRVKVEAEKVRLEIVEKESELLKQKAAL
jgi:hypothetical protein